MESYKEKYLKYKMKYYLLKKSIGGAGEVSWENKPQFDPVYNSKKTKLKSVSCQNSELKIFMNKGKEKRLKWCMDKKSVELKNLNFKVNDIDEYFKKTFYPYILKKMFPESSYVSNDAELIKITFTKEKKEKSIRLRLFYIDKGVEVDWIDDNNAAFDPKKSFSYGFFGKIKEGKLGKHDINLEIFESKYILFLNEFRTQVNEVYKNWVKILQTQKNEDITAFLVELKQFWSSSNNFFISIKK